MTTQDHRRAALLALADEFFIDPKDKSRSAGEDLAEILAEDIPQLAIVTRTGGGEDFSYIRVAETLDDAVRIATHHCGDSIFAEYPHRIENLDTGVRFTPAWSDLPFEQATPAPKG